MIHFIHKSPLLALRLEDKQAGKRAIFVGNSATTKKKKKKKKKTQNGQTSYEEKTLAISRRCDNGSVHLFLGFFQENL